MGEYNNGGLIGQNPESFIPLVDIMAGEKYCIYIDIPGMTADDVTITRTNVFTIIKGTKRHLYDINQMQTGNI